MSHSFASLTMVLPASKFTSSCQPYGLYPTKTCSLVGILKHIHILKHAQVITSLEL